MSFLDHAKFRYGGSYHDHSVDDIKKVGKVLLVFLALIPYWMAYYQVCLHMSPQALDVLFWMHAYFYTWTVLSF